MPQMVKIEADPSFKAEDATQKRDFAEAKKRGAIEMSYVTAVECVRNSGGMYRMKPQPTAQPAAAVRLEDMASDDLKRMFVSMGGKVPTGKQIKRGEIIASINAKIGEFEVLDDDA